MEVERSTSVEGTSFNTKLSKAIKHTLRISLLLSGCFFAVQPGMADTSNLPTVDVPPPPDWEPIDPPDYDPFPETGDSGDDGGGGGGGGGPPGTDPEQTCALLVATRPAMCPNPIPLPSAGLYADDKLPGGSTSSMRMAHNFIKGLAYWEATPIQMDAGAVWFLQAALDDQVSMLAAGVSLTDVNYRMRMHLAMTCDMQVGASDAYRLGITPTKPEQYCFEMLKAFDAEANDNLNFAAWFVSYQASKGVPLDPYVPYGLVALVETRNSIGEKWRAVTEDASCSRWWTQVQANSCGVP